MDFSSNHSCTYYPFGMEMPGRTYTNATLAQSRFGFNGMEKDDEVKGKANSLDFGARIYDSRLGRFLSLDPLVSKFPSLTPYAYAANSPIIAKDEDGREPVIVITDISTGYTIMRVYNAHEVEMAIVVPTYKARIIYRNEDGSSQTLATFNVTRDGYYGLGTASKGSNSMILANHATEPTSTATGTVVGTGNKYGGKVAILGKIYSPIPADFNQQYADGMPTKDKIADNAQRNDGYATDVMVHIGGVYSDAMGQPKLAGGYGCFLVIAPDQVYTKADAQEQADKYNAKGANALDGSKVGSVNAIYDVITILENARQRRWYGMKEDMSYEIQPRSAPYPVINTKEPQMK